MTRHTVAIALVASLQANQPAFIFAEIGLESNLESVAAAHPHSSRSGEHLRVAPQDRRDHIGSIELSGTGGTRRLRISFELPGRPGQPVYPACDAVQQGIIRRYGPPVTVREFDEEASRRSDRVWQSANEEMTLVCFRPPGARRTSQFMAEAVVIRRQ